MIYKGIASYGGKIFALEARLDRLARSMAELNFPSLQRGAFGDEVKKLYQTANIERAFIYIQRSQGVSPPASMLILKSVPADRHDDNGNTEHTRISGKRCRRDYRR